MSELPERSTTEKIWHFVESPVAWGGIGLLGGAIIVLVPVVGLKWIFVFAYLLIIIALIRESFWKGKGWIRIAANALLSILFGVAFVAGWHFIPKPKEPPTLEETAILTAKKIIELMPPQQDKFNSAPIPIPIRKQVPIKAEDAFAVAVETRMFVIPGEGRGTSYWAGGLSPGGCSLQSVQAALFIRITNLQKERILITAYTVEAMGVPLTRIKMNLYKPFVILGRGILKPSNQAGPPIQMPVPQGGVGSWVSFPLKDAYPAEARSIEAEFIDPQLAGHYLEHRQTVRGWSYFHYSSPVLMPVRLVVKITDETSHTYDYPIPDSGSDQNADAMSRTITLGPTIDLSACSIQK